MSWRPNAWPDIVYWLERAPLDTDGTPIIGPDLAAWAIAAEMRPNPFAGTPYELDVDDGVEHR